jgi:outer membrane autotransporter protein
VVEVKDPIRSAAGAFSLANVVAAGPFEYQLFHGGVNGSNPGDWFLRSMITILERRSP